MDKDAKDLGGKRRGKINKVHGGYFDSIQLAATISKRKFKKNNKGGYQTSPDWVIEKAVPMSHKTLKRLYEIARPFPNLGPMQIAALILEHGLKNFQELEFLDPT